MEEEIELNYFHKIYRNKYQELIQQTIKERIMSQEKYEQELFLMFPLAYATQDEKLEASNKSLYFTCLSYLSLSNSNINASSNSFKLLNDILNELEINPYRDLKYKYSFLTSIQFICQNYLDNLDIGFPILFNSYNNLEESYMNILLDSRYKIYKFDCLNMNLLKQTKTMVKVVLMLYNHQIGSMQNTKFVYSKDF